MTDREAPLHVDVFAAFGRDDASIVIAGQPGFGKRPPSASIPVIGADHLAWLHAPLRLVRLLRELRHQRGVHQ